MVSNAASEGRRSFEMTDVELRERVLCGTAATVGRFGGWHSLATSVQRSALRAMYGAATAVSAAIWECADGAAHPAFGAFFICTANAGDIVDQRTNGFAGGECFVYGTEGHSVRSR